MGGRVWHVPNQSARRANSIFALDAAARRLGAGLGAWSAFGTLPNGASPPTELTLGTCRLQEPPLAYESGAQCLGGGGGCMRFTGCTQGGNAFSAGSFTCTVDRPCNVSYWHKGAIWQGFDTRELSNGTAQFFQQHLALP